MQFTLKPTEGFCCVAVLPTAFQSWAIWHAWAFCGGWHSGVKGDSRRIPWFFGRSDSDLTATELEWPFLDIEQQMLLQILTCRQRCLRRWSVLVKVENGCVYRTGTPTEEPWQGNTLSLLSEVFAVARKTNWTQQVIWADQSQSWKSSHNASDLRVVKKDKPGFSFEPPASLRVLNLKFT